MNRIFSKQVEVTALPKRRFSRTTLVLAFLLFGVLTSGLVFFFFYSSAVPIGRRAVYSGFFVEVNAGRCGNIEVLDPSGSDLFVLAGTQVVAVKDLTVADLLIEGFEQFTFDRNVLRKGASANDCGFAKFNDEGEILSLTISRYSELGLRFSASRSGPFLEMPVTTEEFSGQFGEPDDWLYVYHERGDWR